MTLNVFVNPLVSDMVDITVVLCHGGTSLQCFKGNPFHAGPVSSVY